MDFTRDDLLKLYRNITLSRQWDEQMCESFRRGKCVTFLHSGQGHEAVGVGACTFLREDDWLMATHRGRAHAIAKGTPLGPMIAEWYGRKGGLSGGKGGEHFSYMKRGMVGGSGTIGGCFPVTVGLGIAAQRAAKGQVVVCIFGDGAAQRGTLHESMNWASCLKLPIVWICENNLYSISVSIKEAQATEHVADFAGSYNMPGIVIDGQDVLVVARTVLEAVERARKGEGPTLIECKTYRFREHGESDSKSSYKPVEEEAQWMARDPAKLFREYLLGEDIAEEAELQAIDKECGQQVVEAEAWAAKSPWPAPEDAFDIVWAD